jgi:hypothetical protein
VENDSDLSGSTPENPPHQVSEKQVIEKAKARRSRWLFPMGLMATGLAGAAVLFRGCWHRRMSWPVRSGGYSYQVCLGCGVKRLFDEEAFRGYGPYSYELQRLVAWDRSKRNLPPPEAPTPEVGTPPKRSAS